MMKMKLAAVVAAALMATGCATHQQTGMLVGAVVGGGLGSAIGAGTGAIVAGVVGVGVGAAIGGSVGKSMDRQDEARVVRSVETQKTETWTSKSGAQMTSTPSGERVVVESRKEGRVERASVIRRDGKWIKE
jgi:outer membrane lipoprotein SlyB